MHILEKFTIRKQIRFGLGLFYLLSGYFMISSQSEQETTGMQPRFIASRVTSFDFFGEPAIEVILEEAEARPPAGSGQPIDLNELIDAFESPVVTRPFAGDSPLFPDIFPSAGDPLAVMRGAPEPRMIVDRSGSIRGRVLSTEEIFRRFAGNSPVRPMVELDMLTRAPRSPEVEEEVAPDPRLALLDELIGNEGWQNVQRATPEFVPLIRLEPARIELPVAIEVPVLREDFPIPMTIIDVDPPVMIQEPTTNLREAVIQNHHPWPNLPIGDQQYLAQYWQSQLEAGFYIQVFATLQPLTLRREIIRHQARDLPIAITTNSGSLGVMNRLLIGPLRADELGGVEHELRLGGIRDYFLVSSRPSL